MNGTDMPAGLEVAADSLASALAAQEGGAMRVELCGGLDSGGLTPSFGTLAMARERLRIPVYALIRPRSGDFVFSADEVEVMCRDVGQCVRLGCDGVVLGALTPAGDVDVTVMRPLIEAAGSLGVTFHRAFDVCRDRLAALDTIAALGCERILTSGGCPSAIEGADVIAGLVRHADGRIVIMPGAGVAEEHIRALRDRTGAREFHASARRTVPLRSALAGAHQQLGLVGVRSGTDVARVRRLVELLRD